MKTIKNTIIFLLAMLAMVALFAESDNLTSLLVVKAAGFCLFWVIIRIANLKISEQ